MKYYIENKVIRLIWIVNYMLSCNSFNTLITVRVLKSVILSGILCTIFWYY